MDEKDTGAKEEKARRPRRERKEEQKPVQETADEKPPDVTPSGKPRRKRGDQSPQGGGGGGWMSAPAKQVYNNDENDAGSIPSLNETIVAGNKDKHFNDNDDDEILIIPDLDEEGGADADQRVAHAPRNITRRIPTLSELESEAVAAIPTSDIEGLDLTCLQSTLVPLELIKEEDITWTFETLLSEATDEVNGTQQPQPKPKKVVQLSPVKAKAKARSSKRSNKARGD